MKEHNQFIGWLILFLIASVFFGFICAAMIESEWGLAFLIKGTGLAIAAFVLCLICFHFYQKRTTEKELWAMMARGCYREVERRIDADGKEMNALWELKLLALFHSGDLFSFQCLYQEYMNEIHECNTLGRYMLCVLHDLVYATTAAKPPVAFMKEEQRSYSFKKRIDYVMYRNLRLGLHEYYGEQRHMVKIYFEKFLMQTDVLSRPLGFYLYYLMTSVMIDNDHPQWEDYYHRTQQFIFDESSLRLVEEHLHPKLQDMQKGIEVQHTMERDFNHRNNPLFDEQNTEGTDRSFNYQPGFQRSREEQTTFRRHSADVQREFDEMNMDLSANSGFSLYEADETAQKRQPAGMPEDDFSADLDPTWFARKTMEEPQIKPEPQSNAFSRRAPSLSEPVEPQRTRNPMAQDPYQRSSNFQDAPQTFANQAEAPRRFASEEPVFVNQRAQREPLRSDPRIPADPQMQTNRRMHMDSRQPMYQQPQAPVIPQTPPVSQVSPRPQQDHMKNFMAAQNPMMAQAQGQNQTNPAMNNRVDPAMASQLQEPNQRYQRFDDPIPQPAMRQAPQRPQASVSMGQEPEKKKRFGKKKEKQDPFGFDNPNAIAKDPYHQAHPVLEPQAQSKQKAEPRDVQKSVEVRQNRPYSTYVKHNLIIFAITLLDACAVSLATASIEYTIFFKKFSSVLSEVIPNIVMMAAIVTVCIAYLTAGIHTGYTILKHSIKGWSTALKIILSPLILIISLLIGAICEIPYLIFGCIKSGSEK